MLINNHSSNTGFSLKSFNTPLKASAVLITAIMLSACGSDNDQSYTLGDIFDGSSTVKPTPTPTPTPTTPTPTTPTPTTPTPTTPTPTPTTPTPTTPTYKSGSETFKTGVQNLNIDANAALPNTVFSTTSRDFLINSNDLVARADLASGNLLPKVTVITSGAGDSSTANGFKRHEDGTVIPTSLGELPLTYTSVYKDFGTQMRIGHIDGYALLALDPSNPSKLPVNGVAVVGNKTLTLPTEGSLAYGGDATYRVLGLNNAIEYGTSEFTADFVADTIKGKLSFTQAGNISLSANIVGNEFSGTSGTYKTEGAFYGNDAKYIGGIYEGNNAQGTFGAEKQ